MTTIKKVAIGAAIAVFGYQAYKLLSKPKGAEAKSNASGRAGAQRIGFNDKIEVLQSNGKWVRQYEQPTPMTWYLLNGKWVWIKWNGKIAA